MDRGKLFLLIAAAASFFAIHRLTAVERIHVTAAHKAHTTLPAQVFPRDAPHRAWRFKRYIPSDWEQEWFDHVEEWQENMESVCAEPKHAEAAENWIQHIDDDLFFTGYSDEEKANNVPDVFSYFEYESDSGETRLVAIEPLAGLSRHPFFLSKGRNTDYLGNKGYMVISDDMRGKRLILLDAGASVWTRTDGGASEQDWFTRMYIDKRNKELNFERFVAWEMKPHEANAIWTGVRDDVLHAYSYINQGVVPGESGNNPLVMAERIIGKQDRDEFYVVFKLDIDTPAVEGKIAEGLLTDKGANVDEFFYEYHCLVNPMKPYWGEKDVAGISLADTFKFFRAVREKGIRAHSWV